MYESGTEMVTGGYLLDMVAPQGNARWRDQVLRVRYLSTAAYEPEQKTLVFGARAAASRWRDTASRCKIAAWWVQSSGKNRRTEAAKGSAVIDTHTDAVVVEANIVAECHTEPTAATACTEAVVEKEIQRLNDYLGSTHMGRP